MALSRSTQVRVIGGAFQTLASVCIIVGAVVGWALPHSGLPLAAAFSHPVAASGVDAVTFLGAALTTLGVIVAILIGYNVAGLQTAGQLMSLALARAMLLSLAPFLIWWTITTGVGLVYLLLTPAYMGQLWQVLIWFAAVVLFMLGYLWTLPWRLSGEYAARWAVDDLRNVPIERWESQDGYDVLQSSMAAATTRGDLGAIRAMAQTLASFLVTMRDARTERGDRSDRGRYRALKNLLSGCAQFSGAAPTSVSYQLGYVAAGILLRAAAIGLPTNTPEINLFSGLLRSIGDSADRIDSLWTGARHSLCRGDSRADPYLLTYWMRNRGWSGDDPRLTQRLADGLMRLQAEALRIQRHAQPEARAQLEAAHMLDDLYRYLSTYLRERIEATARGAERARLLGLAGALLAQTHTLALAESATWSDEARALLASGYERSAALLPAVVGALA